MSKYCLVEEGVIIEGPKTLPKAWRNISGLNLLDDTALKALGWLPYVNDVPAIDPRIQYLTSEIIIGEDNVTRAYTVNDNPVYDEDTQYITSEGTVDVDIVYTVHDYTAQEMIARIASAKLEKIISLKDTVDFHLNDKLKEYRTYTDAEFADVDAATTLAEIRVVDADLDTVDTTTSAVRTIFEDSIMWDIDYSQVDTYLDANVTNLAEAKAYLKKLSKVVLALLKFNGLVK